MSSTTSPERNHKPLPGGNKHRLAGSRRSASVSLPPLLERSARFGEHPSASSRPPLRHTPVSLHLPR